MKRAAVVVLSAVLTLLLGAIAAIPFNGWYWRIRGYQGGYDDESRMFDFLVLIEWPLLVVAGALAGNAIYKKWLSKPRGGTGE